MLEDPGFWVAVGFFAFVAILVYYKIPEIITKKLDERATKIEKQIKEAEKIKNEAQKILTEYEDKQREAKKKIQLIIENAKIDAKKQSEKLMQYNEKNMQLIKASAQKRIEQIYADEMIEQKRKIAMIAANSVEVIIRQNQQYIDQKMIIKNAIETMQKSL